jgi:hypothetical protein
MSSTLNLKIAFNLTGDSFFEMELLKKGFDDKMRGNSLVDKKVLLTYS